MIWLIRGTSELCQGQPSWNKVIRQNLVESGPIIIKVGLKNILRTILSKLNSNSLISFPSI